MTDEFWKDIKGFEGYYQVSDLGNVRSLDRVIVNSLGRQVKYKGKKLKPSLRKDGYVQCQLKRQTYTKYFNVHVLVARAFLSYPDNKAAYEVNHIDEDKTNNRLSNLEYVTPKYNANHGTRIERITLANRETHSNPTMITSIYDSSFVLYFTSSMDCMRKTNGFFDSGEIRKCCNGQRKMHKGFIFTNTDIKEYSEITDDIIENIKTLNNCYVYNRFGIKKTELHTGKVSYYKRMESLLNSSDYVDSCVRKSINKDVPYKNCKFSRLNREEINKILEIK